ncbi:MAG: exopolyphosphatase [Rhodothermales bacterium]|nr:exopolyphosphatase [Rhodothermales bacterium]
MSQLIGTIDVGTNTAHLLISTTTPDGGIMPRRTETRYVRLGQGVDASGEIQPAALERLRTALSEFGAIAAGEGVEHLFTAGTSASRDSADPDGLIEFVREHTGIEYEIISGEEEALLTSLGAVSCLDLADDVKAVVVDIGGGSTELTYTQRTGGTMTLAALSSLNVGSVRLTERCFEQLPPLESQVAEAESTVRRALEAASRPAGGSWMMVGAAGTIRALALIADGKAPAARPGGKPRYLARREVASWRRRLLSLNFDETLALNPTVLAGRADVIAAGVLVLDVVFDYLGADRCIVSPWGLRHGLAIRYARRLAGLES